MDNGKNRVMLSTQTERFCRILTVCDVLSEAEGTTKHVDDEHNQDKPGSPQICPRPRDPSFDFIEESAQGTRHVAWAVAVSRRMKTPRCQYVEREN